MSRFVEVSLVELGQEEPVAEHIVEIRLEVPRPVVRPAQPRRQPQAHEVLKGKKIFGGKTRTIVTWLPASYQLVTRFL